MSSGVSQKPRPACQALRAAHDALEDVLFGSSTVKDNDVIRLIRDADTRVLVALMLLGSEEDTGDA